MEEKLKTMKDILGEDYEAKMKEITESYGGWCLPIIPWSTIENLKFVTLSERLAYFKEDKKRYYKGE